jgi:hypothetical protein
MSDFSSTEMICSGFDKFGTCNTAVKADNISMSSNTCLKIKKRTIEILTWSVYVSFFSFKFAYKNG